MYNMMSQGAFGPVVSVCIAVSLPQEEAPLFFEELPALSVPGLSPRVVR
jgi:hypothetical protein